jgi:hypothetical protein
LLSESGELLFQVGDFSSKVRNFIFQSGDTLGVR